MNLYGIMGSPIQHSKSPLIHQLFAKQTQQNLVYQPFLVEPDELEQALFSFASQGGLGLNITAPLKQKAFELMHDVSDRAARAQTINTILFDKKGNRFGDNT